MTEKKKSKTVSWASGSKLCQAKHIRKSDPPFKVGQKVRKITHRKNPSHFPTTCPAAYVPLKNEANVNQTNEKLHKIPHIKWEIPPVFVLDSDWLIASGEESEETKVQKPEKVYPPSPYSHSDFEDQCFDDSQTPIIPITPSEEADSSAMSPPPKTRIHILPPTSFPDPDRSKNSKSDPMEGDALLAAVAAVTAIMRSMDPGSLIDTDLLIKFLKDPDLTLQLINSQRFAANNTEPGGRKTIEEVVSVPTPSVLTQSSGQPKDRVGKSALETLTTKTGTGGRLIVDLPSKKCIGGQSELVNSEMFNMPNPIILPPIVTGSVFGANDHVVRINPPAGTTAQPDLTVIKRMIRDYGLSDDLGPVILGPEPLLARNDNSARSISHSEPFGESAALQHLSYYQFLMKQHGQTQKKWDEPHSTKSNTQSYLHIHNLKTQETCVYFNTAKGCRNGSKCLFRHEAFDQKKTMGVDMGMGMGMGISRGPDAKRMKVGLGRELMGRT